MGTFITYHYIDPYQAATSKFTEIYPAQQWEWECDIRSGDHTTLTLRSTSC